MMGPTAIWKPNLPAGLVENLCGLFSMTDVFASDYQPRIEERLVPTIACRRELPNRVTI